MKTTTYVQEAAKLAGRNSDGSYPVVIITEGEGSTGSYGAALMSDESAGLFENVASYMDHPIDPTKPHLRPVLSIGGRIKNVRAGESEGKAALLGDYFPRKEYAGFIEEFADTVGLSIFSLANGTKQPDGRLLVESFAAEDPYRSVDVVVAAGRGGKFQRAAESLRTIESSLGIPEGNKPASTSAAGTHTQEEERMTPEEIKAAVASAVAEMKTSVDAAVAELKDATAAARQAEADANASKTDAKKAVEAFADRNEAIEKAELVEELSAPLVEAAKGGADITADLEKAVALQESLSKRLAPSDESASAVFEGYVVSESAAAANGNGDFDFRTGFGKGL